MKRASATKAGNHCSRILREVRAGQAYTVTLHERPVATILPVGYSTARMPRRRAAHARLLKRLHGQALTGPRDWFRSDLYD